MNTTEKHFVIGGKKRNRYGIFRMTWAFVLEPIGTEATHLVVRAKMIMSQKFKEWFMGNIIYPPVHALREKVQLYRIRHFAEKIIKMHSCNN
jgi:NOL1/NOP2/fmu family ribosome biogenesis protein